jgi:hypothetical protein
MTHERKKLVTIHLFFVAAMLVCGFFSLTRSTYHTAFDYAFFALVLVNAWLSIRYNLKNKRQPDTLTHLFQGSSQTLKERS